MKRWIIAAGLAFVFAGPAFAQSLIDGFTNPPQEARPRVWWHWMDGNVSMDGIVKDIEWMERAGIAGFHQFDAGGIGMEKIIAEPKPYNSPQWREAMLFAIKLAKEKGMETAVASAPGWSSTGGPWVKPEDAMKKLTWKTVEVAGPGKVDLRLPDLLSTPGKYQNLPIREKIEPWSAPVAIIAVKLADGDLSMQEMGASVSSSGGVFSVVVLTNGDYNDAVKLPAVEGGEPWIQYSFERPQLIKAVTLCGGARRSIWHRTPPSYRERLEASDDGITWTKVCDIPTPLLNVQTFDIPATKAHHFRLVTDGLRKVSEFILHGVVKVDHAQDKAGFTAAYDFAEYPTPDDPDAISTVLDLSDLEHDGSLSWNVPEGRWRIYRFGMALTGKQNHPAPPEATGLEVDKLDPEAWNNYFKEFLKIYEGAPVQYLLTDSYEAGQMTWTRNMFKEFEQRRGYALRPWLPALAGEVLRSADETDRFLFDWRQTIGELMTENYDRLEDIAHAAGMKGRYTESHENGRIYVGDGMDLKRTADIPMSAIWMDNANAGSAIPMAMADIRESASVAHIFGQNIVAAESFTTSGVDGKTCAYCPENMKNTADIALFCGLNRFVIHDSAHQPSDAHRPGLDLRGYGQWFTRHDTWAEEARVWTDYLARSCFLLQQGKYKADILYYYGEDNCVVGLFGTELPEIPAGYSYDFINPTGLLQAVSPVRGQLVSASGMNYKLLVLDRNCRIMSLPLLKRILFLAQAGVPVCGTLPERPASLTDDDKDFYNTLAQLKPLFLNMPVEQALKHKGIAPDFVAPKGWLYVHRETPGEDIYWIRNFSGVAGDGVILVRAGAGTPVVMDPASGKTHRINASSSPEGYRRFSLRMEDNDALFVVISKAQEAVTPDAIPERFASLTLEGPWTLRFESGLGAPEKAVFDKLMSYTESEDPSIRYYSGTVRYSKSFSLKKKQLKKSSVVEIDLGSVKNMARVFVNGHDLGVAWKAPFRLDIPAEYLHTGTNELEVKVINLWPNRIIGDLQPGTDKKWTYLSTSWYKADSPLLPSGLLGPVQLNFKH